MCGDFLTMQNIYNSIAELCCLVISSCTEDFFVKYSCVSSDEKKRINLIVGEKIPALFSDKNCTNIRHISESDLNDVFFLNLAALSSELALEADYFAIVGLIQIFGFIKFSSIFFLFLFYRTTVFCYRPVSSSASWRCV